MTEHSLTNWEVFHLYRRLVEDGKAKPLICPDDDSILVTRIGHDDEPMLWCYECLATIRPGLDLVQRVRAVVTEHYT